MFRLNTDRFYMRELNPGDADGFYRLNLHPDIYRFTTDPPFKSVEDASEFLQNYNPYCISGFGRWAILRNNDDVFVGWCGLKYLPDENEVDVGYRLLPEFWGQGIAAETGLASCKYGFEIAGLRTICARAHKENLRSIRAIEKMGMHYENEILRDGVSWLNFILTNPRSAGNFKEEKIRGYMPPAF